MKCPSCQADIKEEAKFCGKCGTKLSLICPQCSSENPPGNNFCEECGHKLTIPVEPSPKDLSFDEKIDKIQRYLPKGLTEKILSQKNKIVKNHKPCWQIKKCSADRRKNCPAWEFKTGDLCWFISGTVCEGSVHDNWQEKMHVCRTCKVFKSQIS